MKKEFLENVFNILSKNLNVEEILSKSKETSIRNFKKNLISFSENKLTKAEMEKVISSFLEKYVNDIEIFKYNLFRYKSFFDELDDFLLGECYEIREHNHPYTGEKYYKIISPTEILKEKEMWLEWEEQSSVRHEYETKLIKEEEEVYKNKQTKLARENQFFIKELVGYYNDLLTLLKKHLDNPQINIEDEREFRETISKIVSLNNLLSFGNFIDENTIQFKSLFSLEEDWSLTVSQYNKKTSDRKLTEAECQFNIENIRSLILKETKKINKYIDYSVIKSNTPKTEELIINTISGKLSINKVTGEVSLNQTSFSLSPASELFKILTKIAEGNGTYEELGYETKAKRIELTQKIKKLKQQLEMLPKNKGLNKDIFRNNKGYSYVIITSE